MFTYKNFMLRASLVAAFLISTPVAAQAASYDTNVRLVDDLAAVFTTTVSFSVNDDTIRIPVFGAADSNTASRFSYNLSHAEATNALPSIGFVVSEQPINNDGYYYFGPNERATFTFTTIAPLPFVGANVDDFDYTLDSVPLHKLVQ